jgi:acyl-CoA reductase-like NAD-dependent aldehyde dehydrogenase
MTYDNRQFYIDGAWVDPAEPKDFTVINPASEAPAGVISMGSAKDVDRAVGAPPPAVEWDKPPAPGPPRWPRGLGCAPHKQKL